MENPQKENGYTPIANEIMEALARTKLNTQESRILFAIIRKTYGYNKKSDWISNSQLEQITGIHRSHCANTVTRLIQRKVVTKTGNKIQFNKLYSQWKELPKQVTKQVTAKVLPKQDKLLPKQVQVLPEQVHTIIDNTKDNIQKKEQPDGCGTINNLLDAFKKINPTINFGNTTQRKCLDEIVEKFGYEKTLKTIEYAVSVQGQKFAPTITTPYQLKNKLGDLMVFYKKESGSPRIVKI